MTTKQAFFCASILGTALCHGQGNIVYYGVNSNALNVVFEDTNLSVSNQTLIVADLNRCLQSGWGKEMEFKMGNDDPAFVAHLFNWSRSPYYDPFPKNIINTPDGHALHISQGISDAYIDRLAFAAAHSNIVAAAYEFVAFVNSTNFPSIPANDMPNYLVPKNLSDAEMIASAQNLITALTSTYDPPSILSFGYREFEFGSATSNLFTALPKSTSFGFFNSVPAIWHDERWKFIDIRWFIDLSNLNFEENE